MTRALIPEVIDKLIEHAKKPLPTIVVELRQKIEARTRVLELRKSSSGQPPKDEEIAEVVQMKLELDALYGRWFEEGLKCL